MKKAFFALFAIALALWSIHPARGQTGGFIIQDADETNTLSFTPSSSLDALLNQIAPRFVMRSADARADYVFTPVPNALDTLMSTLLPRFTMRSADANVFMTLTPATETLLTRLEQVAPRFIMRSADTSKTIALDYPTDLIGDTTPPQVTSLDTSQAGDDGTTISWITDEYADSFVRYGTASGVYTSVVSDTLYVTNHSLTLQGLTPGTRYYAQASSTDLSGNTWQSDEFVFTQKRTYYINLPLILRSH
jgi:hypothetical protein